MDDLMQLAKDLGAVAVAAKPNLRKALEVTARHVKDDTRKAVRAGSKTWRGLPPAVDYEVTSSADGVTAEVGYDKDRAAGKLGNIREFGAPGARRTVVSGGETIPTAQRLPRAAHHDLQNALKANEPDFEKGIELAVDSVLKEHGL